MPLYEYDCQDCGAHAEILVRGQETLHCPACEGTQLQRTLSTFAVSTGRRPSSGAAAPGSCGRCGDPRGPGACSMN
jgi:putative FmdB family regulatory protein